MISPIEPTEAKVTYGVVETVGRPLPAVADQKPEGGREYSAYAPTRAVGTKVKINWLL